MRLIDADALKAKAFGRRGGLIHTADIDEMPTVEERKTGKWEYLDCGYTDYYVCDQCGSKEDYKRNFCPECGADMRGE